MLEPLINAIVCQTYALLNDNRSHQTLGTLAVDTDGGTLGNLRDPIKTRIRRQLCLSL
jgi:hypothetical protein